MNDELKYLSIEEIKKVGIDKKLATEKKLLNSDDYNLYLQIQALYKKFFDNYLNQKINPNSLDQKIINNNLKIRCLNKEEKNIYQNWSSLDSNYLYVRNFFYMERLSIEDITVLKQALVEEEKYKKELLDIVSKTFKEVIKVNFKDIKNQRYRVFYGGMNPIYEFYNDSLVLFMNYKILPQDDDNIYINNKSEAANYFNYLKQDMEKKISDILKCNVEVSFYDFKFQGENVK